MSKEKYLVTGGAGFIGSNIVDELLARGKEVVVIDNFITGSRDNLAHVMNDIELVEGDIRDLDLMKKICTERMIAFGQAGMAPKITCITCDDMAKRYKKK